MNLSHVNKHLNYYPDGQVNETYFVAHHDLNNDKFEIKGHLIDKEDTNDIKKTYKKEILLSCTYYVSNLPTTYLYRFRLTDDLNQRKQYGFDEKHSMTDIFNILKQMYLKAVNIYKYDNLIHYITHHCCIKINNVDISIYLLFTLCESVNNDKITTNKYLFLAEILQPISWNKIENKYDVQITTTSHSINMTLITDDNKYYYLTIDNNYLVKNNLTHFSLQAIYDIIIIAHNSNLRINQKSSYNTKEHSYYTNIEVNEKKMYKHRIRLHLHKLNQFDYFNLGIDLIYSKTPFQKQYPIGSSHMLLEGSLNIPKNINNINVIPYLLNDTIIAVAENCIEYEVLGQVQNRSLFSCLKFLWRR